MGVCDFSIVKDRRLLGIHTNLRIDPKLIPYTHILDPIHLPFCNGSAHNLFFWNRSSVDSQHCVRSSHYHDKLHHVPVTQLRDKHLQGYRQSESLKALWSRCKFTFSLSCFIFGKTSNCPKLICTHVVKIRKVRYH